MSPLAFAVLLLAVIKQRCIAAGAPFWIGGELPVFVVRHHAPNRYACTVTVRYEYMYRVTPRKLVVMIRKNGLWRIYATQCEGLGLWGRCVSYVRENCASYAHQQISYHMHAKTAYYMHAKHVRIICTPKSIFAYQYHEFSFLFGVLFLCIFMRPGNMQHMQYIHVLYICQFLYKAERNSMGCWLFSYRKTKMSWLSGHFLYSNLIALGSVAVYQSFLNSFKRPVLRISLATYFDNCLLHNISTLLENTSKSVCKYKCIQSAVCLFVSIWRTSG